ncbi:MAG: PPC domain-containing protein [Pirellulaceae bacterium]
MTGLFKGQIACSRSGFIPLLLFCVLILVNALSVESAFGSDPRLNVILPRGVQRGAQHTLRFSGERLGEAQQVMFYDSGITPVEIKPVDANQFDLVVDVAADCRLGEHVCQVRTLRGLSDYRSVYIGNLPNVDEVEPNSSLETRQSIEMNHTVSGTIDNEDVDYFLVAAKKGERISVEVEAIRLGAIFDPFVAILDENRFELAVSDDTAMFDQDSFVSIVVPEDGNYTILVRESAYGGNGNCRYRLHVGNFPRPTAVYPAGGAVASTAELTFLGDPSGEIKHSVTIDPKSTFRPGLFLEHETGLTPSPFPFRFNDLSNAMEVEPNNGFDVAAVSQLPQAFNGIIQADGDVDFFQFEAKQGQVWEVECYAKRIGSALDPVIHIFQGSDKKVLVGNDDSRGPDSYLRFEVPADGNYFVRVYDHLKRGKPDFVYRIEFTPVTAKLTTSIPRVDRYSQQRQSIPVPQGGRFATLINATRENFGGEIALLEENLPPGIKMISKPMVGNLSQMPVVFEAAADAELTGALVDLRAKLLAENQDIQGGFANNADFANGEPNNVQYYGCTVERLAMAVTKPAPFSLEIVQPQAPLVRDGSYSLRVVAKRDEGFTAPINVQFPFRPPGVGTTTQVTIPEGQTEVVYTLNANANAQLGTWPVYVIGNSAVEGGALWTSSQLADLVIADPYVRIEVPRAGCDQGQTAQILCKFEQLTPFDGEATVSLLGLPPNTAVEPQKFTKDTTELVFNIPTTDQVPLGQHKSLFCQLQIPVSGETVVSSTGKTELAINKPGCCQSRKWHRHRLRRRATTCGSETAFTT